MKLGHFNKTDAGLFEGRIQTLTLSADLRFVPITEKTNDAHPDFRIVDAKTETEYGAAWHKMSQDSKPYISAEIDDPSLPAAIHPILSRDDNGDFNLYWNRPRKKKNGNSAQTDTL